MAILGKLKSVFGFSDEEYEMEENGMLQQDATVTPLSQRRLNNQPSKESGKVNDVKDDTIKATLSQQPSVSEKIKCPEEIFNKVVEIFNQSLPSFIRESIDPVKQTKYIYEALDNSMKEFITKLENDADQRIRTRLENDQTSVRRELEALKEKSKKIEEANNEWKEQKLSAERQKRALSERVHDLEKQIDTFNAEKEQFELENRSLVNKLRAVSVQDTDLESLRSENEDLRNEIKSLKENTVTNVTPAVDQKIIKELNDLKIQTEDLAAQKDNLIRERNILANDIIVLKKKCEISDGMINDLNHKASSAKLALSEKEKQLQELQTKYEQIASETNASTAIADKDNLTEELSSRDTIILQLKEELSQKDDDLQKAHSEVEESRQALITFEESLIKIDKLNESRQNRISELQKQVKETEEQLVKSTTQLADKDKDISAKDEEIASLKESIEKIKQLQAASETLLREEIERLRNSSENTPRQKRKKIAQISSIDDSLDDTNWLVSTPPEGTNARPTGVSDSEFGYQEPQHREEPNNPAQMSLW